MVLMLVSQLDRSPFPEVTVCAVTYQVSQRIQLLPHQTALASPPRHLAIHEVEKQSKGHEPQCCPNRAKGIRWAKAVAHGANDGHEAAKTCRGAHARSGQRMDERESLGGRRRSRKAIKPRTVQFRNQVGEVEGSAQKGFTGLADPAISGNYCNLRPRGSE